MTSKISVWQTQLAQAFTSITALCDYLQLDFVDLALSTELKHFPLRVPRNFAELMQPGNPNDPLLRQVLPLAEELIQLPGYSHDPVGDLAAVVREGLIHKYQGRVLFIVTGACAIHCRYCFRRNFPYSEQQLNREKLNQALSYIENQPDISEIILSGGDPLLLSDNKLAELFQRLQALPQIKRIRIHSRIPVVLPSRITPELLDIFLSTSQQIILVMHANHARELSPAVAEASRVLKQQAITLLNQSVLLAGVNDDADTLCELSERLFSLGVLPYYLHALDHAHGTGHFAVSDSKAIALLEAMRLRLPGYLVPKLVKEQAGAGAKTPLGKG